VISSAQLAANQADAQPVLVTLKMVTRAVRLNSISVPRRVISSSRLACRFDQRGFADLSWQVS
jgi:hypothetical protein